MDAIVERSGHVTEEKQERERYPSGQQEGASFTAKTIHPFSRSFILWPQGWPFMLTPTRHVGTLLRLTLIDTQVGFCQDFHVATDHKSVWKWRLGRGNETKIRFLSFESPIQSKEM